MAGTEKRPQLSWGRVVGSAYALRMSRFKFGRLGRVILPGAVTLRNSEQDRQWVREHSLARANLHNSALRMCAIRRHRHGKRDRGGCASFDIGELGDVRFQHLAEATMDHERCLGDVRAAAECRAQLDGLAGGDGLCDAAGAPGQAGGLAFAGWRLARPAMRRFGLVVASGRSRAKGEQQQGYDSERDDQMTVPGHECLLVDWTAATFYRGHRINPSTSEIDMSTFVLASTVSNATAAVTHYKRPQ